jgi:hypothetical protein
MRYELWELSAGNMIGVFETEADALRAVADAINRYGIDRVSTLSLDYDDPNGEGYPIAEGAELARRALEADAATA